ncbi:MAG TPA: hypothetical protein VM366_16460 [Anaerolineae bacterium]|nr:hypothetical protein [Anaerolineae bacterium]
MQEITEEWISEQRAQHYRRTPALRVESVEEARAFVDAVGFCHFWPIKGIETPNLFHAIAGRDRAVPNAHDDPDLSRCWGWKDQSLDKRWWHYAKVLRRRATLISLDMLPCFYACSENYGDLEDYLLQYEAGTMTMEARQIYEALLRHGPLDTVRLRREARLASDSSKSRFDRGLTELQVGFKVMPVGVAEAGAWNYAFMYEIVQRHWPGLPAKARAIRRSEARRALVSQYVDNVIAIDRSMVERVFHVMNWTKSEWEHTFDALLEADLVREVKVQGGANQNSANQTLRFAQAQDSANRNPQGQWLASTRSLRR